jgi:dTMP kinase
VKERGRLIAIEGIDGSGKTTQARLLADRLGALLTHEPGATVLGRQLRGLLLESPGSDVSPRAEALLMAADRAQHVVEVVAPALAAGRWVVSDRFSGSTLAYQGYGRGLDLEELRSLVDWASGGLTPDLHVLVDVPPALAGERRVGSADRLERLEADFHERVRQGYLDMARSHAARWVVVDGTPPASAVADAVGDAVAGRLGPAVTAP